MIQYLRLNKVDDPLSPEVVRVNDLGGVDIDCAVTVHGYRDVLALQSLKLSAIGEVGRVSDFFQEMVGLEVVDILCSHAFGVDRAAVWAEAA